ncbi:glycosyltransferase family 4 protein [Nocardioides litoris]|uniref:glycosyltransferase family 4 protein n=1 Tax=Nocardioides litoris TaxID=1926648 RepID=UPI001476D585|nr:glycosyltransferase family 4 protein [Nocardioides litoris]
MRELRRRGVPARVVTVGLGVDDGRAGFDVPFHTLATWGEVGDLDDTVVFVSEAPPVTTRHPAYQVLHVPPPGMTDEQSALRVATSTRTLIATSRYAAGLWAEFLDVDVQIIHVVRPFAEPVFARTARPATVGRRVLYAGRLAPEKGIYTLLSMLHHELLLAEPALHVTVTRAGADKIQGAIIEQVVAAHPGVHLVAARTTPASMAQLMVEHDVVVMPSNSQYWHETFGIVSLEAQHAGCRVVASDDGGLPETDCGALDLVEPDNARALAHGVLAALDRGPVDAAVRADSALLFTVAQSVDEMLDALDAPVLVAPAAVISHLEELVALPSADLAGSSGGAPRSRSRSRDSDLSPGRPAAH